MNDIWLSYIVAIDPVLDHHGQVTGLIGASFDITTQRQLEAAQRENEIQMTIQRNLLKTREAERVNIARDIHDGPLQTLMGMIFDIFSLKEEGREAAMNARLTSLEGSLKKAVQELRQVVNELRPPGLDNFGLGEAIREHAQEIHRKFPDLDLVLDLDEKANTLPNELALTFYRICQEALQNVIRHSKATNVALQLLVADAQVILVVRDNGVGFSMGDDFTELVANKHYGLTGMKERAEAVGGILQVSSVPGEGTEIKAICSIRR
jgi:signal transduction histidine kinase